MLQKVRFQIGGMSCQACATRIEKILARQSAISDSEVNFAGEEAQLRYDSERINEKEIIQLIAKAGFTARPINLDNLPDVPEIQSPPWTLWLLWLLTIPFLIGMLGMLINQPAWMLPAQWQFILATIVQFGLAWPFYKSAFASIKGGLANMDVLVSLGTLSIWFYSCYVLFGHHSDQHVYFEASVMVIAFVSLGKYLENRTKKQSLNSVNLLLQLTPATVRRQEGQNWQIVPMTEINRNDVLLASGGDRVAADGKITYGEAWFDESHLTGESKPLCKKVSDVVLAGALVCDGQVYYQVENTGTHTVLGDMIMALGEAQGSKAPIARLADKVAAVFVPMVVGIAVCTFFFNWIFIGELAPAITRAVSVLVIACPCALGLATPAAIMVGMGRAARYGVWFKDAASLERSSQVTTVVLDKTGTLTEGKARVIAQWQPNNCPYTSQQLWQWVGSVEQSANHPLATALLAEAKRQHVELLPVSQLHNEQGLGISANLDDIGEIRIGKPEYCHVQLPISLQNDYLWQIASIVVVTINDMLIGAFALADDLKKDSISAVRRLQKQNIDVQVMSGDHEQVVSYVATQLGVSQAYADMKPRQKAEAIEQLQRQGKVVAMVGDGVNDAPALARADVSFAMSDSADVASHTASATLMQHSINQVADTLSLARLTMRNIKQNLFFAFFYNILGIPLAAVGLLSPVIAGLAMALSSISVLLNALRLRHSQLKS